MQITLAFSHIHRHIYIYIYTSHDINQFRSALNVSFLQINFTHWRNILLGIPIEILAQCTHFKSKHLNNPTCNITQYHSILLLLI
jgi:hypothetical protein